MRIPDHNHVQAAGASTKRKNVFRPVLAPGFFDEEHQRAMLTACGDPLVTLNALRSFPISLGSVIQKTTRGKNSRPQAD
jgi:hypothetical protein